MSITGCGTEQLVFPNLAACHATQIRRADGAKEVVLHYPRARLHLSDPRPAACRGILTGTARADTGL